MFLTNFELLKPKRFCFNFFNALSSQGLLFPGMGIPNGVAPIQPQTMAQPTNGGPVPVLASTEMETRMFKYMEYLNKEMRNNANQMGASPIRNTTPPNPGQTMHPFEMSRMALWSMYNNNTPPVEPQKEALNLANGTTMSRPSSVVKSEPDVSLEDDDEEEEQMNVNPAKKPKMDTNVVTNGVPCTATNIKIDTRGGEFTINNLHMGEKSFIDGASLI